MSESERFDRTQANSEHVGDLLSAYIDSRLAKGIQAQVREHLTVCADCRADYIELRATRQMLRSLPTVPPPRAFTLTQDMVAAKPGFWQRLLSPRNSSRFALGSALSFTLLAFLLLGNYFTSARLGLSSSEPMAAFAPKNTADSYLQPTAPPNAAGAPAEVTNNYGDSQTAAPPQAQAIFGSTPAPDIAGIAPLPTGMTMARPTPAMENAPAVGGAQSSGGASGINPVLPAPQPTAPIAAQAPQPSAATNSQGLSPNTAERVPALTTGITASTVTSPSTYELDTQNGTTFGSNSYGFYTGTPGSRGQNYDANGRLVQNTNATSRDGASDQNNIELSPSLMAEASLALLGIALAVGALLAKRR